MGCQDPHKSPNTCVQVRFVLVPENLHFDHFGRQRCASGQESLLPPRFWQSNDSVAAAQGACTKELAQCGDGPHHEKKGVFLAGRMPPKRQLGCFSSMSSSAFQELAVLGSIVVAPRARARRLPHLRQQAATRARSPSCWPSRSCGLLTAAALSVGLAHGEGLCSKSLP